MAANDFRFRVSDAVGVPLRGYMLRLKLVDGAPKLDSLQPGSKLRLTSPTGESREVVIHDLTVTAGNMTQKLLEENRLLDVLITESDANRDGSWVGIGWEASGPVESGAR